MNQAINAGGAGLGADSQAAALHAMLGYGDPEGKTGSPPGAQPASLPAVPAAQTLQALPSCSDNPLVKAAMRLLNLIPSLRTASAVGDPGKLRHTLINEIRFFEAQAQAANVSRDEIVGARYCLCTALDEAAGQTPWGGQGVWARHSLLVTFHNETWGGEKYYQLLARLAQYPERHRNLIELLYYCNMLGFEGKFRIAENGHAQLEILKRRIAGLLTDGPGSYETRLSSHWRGEQTVREVWRMIPPWVVAAACGLLAFGVYVWLNFSLQPTSDQVSLRLAALEAPRPEVIVPMPPPKPRLRSFLAPEIAAGLVEVHELPDRSTIILKGDGLFNSGQVNVKGDYLPVLSRIAQALDEIDGQVVVAGYTDNVPIRSALFPSNWHLSLARARAVTALLSGQMNNGEQRVRAEGRGEANPVASNASAAGRARNRRVEITLLLSAEEILGQMNLNASSQLVPATQGVR